MKSNDSIYSNDISNGNICKLKEKPTKKIKNLIIF